MTWDPITRIVGQPRHLHQDRLQGQAGRGVPQHLVDLPRLQHLHEGQGPPRRALHHQPDLRDLRRQPRHLLGLQPEHGLRGPPAAPGRVDHQPGRGRGVHVRPQHLPGEPGRGGLLREDGRRDQPRRAGAGQRHRGAARGRPRLPHHRRHHALAEPARGRVLPRGAAGQPVHPGDVLPDGGQARAPVHAVPRRRGHGRDGAAVHRLPDPADALRGVHEAGRADARRPVRLLLRGAARLRGSRQAAGAARLLGQPEQPRVLRLHLPEHGRLGPQDVRHARRGGGRQAGHDQPGRHQPGHQDPARPLVLRGLGRQGDVRHPRRAGQPGRPAAPVEPAHDPAAAKARLRQRVQLDHVAALVRRQGLPAAGHRRRPDRPAVGDRAGRPGRLRLRAVHRAQREDQPAADHVPAGEDVRVEDPGGQAGPAAVQRDRAGPGPDLLPGLLRRGARCTSSSRRWPRSGPGGPRPGSRSTCPRTRSAAASPRRCAACCRTTW